ncbi:MAG: hypothetical protein M3020_24940 [Myxococcota bacterium]|nr:hypothetical protein [Myxococcota bacterium]
MNAVNSVCMVPVPAELSDGELLAATRRLVGRSNQLLASLLAHLGEVEARGIHRTRACASLYTYCIYELRFSEDEAFRRVSAARMVQRFPALLDAVAAGEIHLTGLLMLGPHLTAENLVEVLARAKHRTKKEIARLVRQLDPLPRVPARIEPLGPEYSQLVPRAPTWDQFVSSFNPVRELEAGHRPRDWMDEIDEMDEVDETVSTAANDAPDSALEAPAPARVEPQRYRVQFEASEEYVGLVERAKALLSHAAPGAGLAELHVRAMRALVAELERERYAVTERPRSSVEREGDGEDATKVPRRRARRVPAAIRRAVFERDRARCTFRSESGERCRETERLELHRDRSATPGCAPL